MNFQLIISTFFLPCLLAISHDGPTIQTTSGVLKGRPSSTDGVQAFLGVPYAKSPTGSLRFKRTSKAEPTPNRILDASRFGSSCVQFPHAKEMINPLLDSRQHKISEDCLFLNVFRPSNGVNLPIVVFIPGEGFDFADATQFDGSVLAAAADAIVVTVQYRVGLFGFLQTNDGIADGNMGLWDILTAIDWVKDNAKSFGGDTSKVTLFGRFSGSMAASLLLTSPVLRSEGNFSLPLFSKVVLSSGLASPDWAIDMNPEGKVEHVLSSLGCDDTKCLMDATTDDLLSLSYGWRPTIDETIVQSDPLTEVRRGNIATGVTQVMVGKNKVDGTICLMTHWAMKNTFYDKLVTNDVSRQDIRKMLQVDNKVYFGGKLDINQSYRKITRNQDKNDLRNRYLDFCSQSLVHNQLTDFSDSLKNIEDIKVFDYEFQERAPESIVPTSVTADAGHGDDIIYAFGLPLRSSESTKDQRRLSRIFMSSLGNFLETGNPDPSGEKGWTHQSVQAINVNTYGVVNATTCPSSSSVDFLTTSHDYSSWQLVNSLSL